MTMLCSFLPYFSMDHLQGYLCPLPLEPPSRLSQSSLHHITNSPWLSILYMAVCMLGFPGGSAGKESACSAGDLGLIPGLGRAPGEGKGYPLQYSGLENPMDSIVLGVTKSQTQLNDFHFHRDLLKVESYSICLLVTGLFHFFLNHTSNK